MKRSLCFFVFIGVLSLFPATSSAEKVPRKIAGFTLGDKISMYLDLVRMETAVPLRDQLYLRVAETKELDGYKSGTIVFGDCADPGRVVRIKLKYALSDKKFYDELLKRFEQRFGEPDEWRGDPFHVIIAWKWSFRDTDGNRISLILQHSRDEEQKWGNSVKLTNMTLLGKERSCYENKRQMSADDTEHEKRDKARLKKLDYQRFIPEY